MKVSKKVRKKCEDAVGEVIDKMDDQREHGTQYGIESDKSWTEEIVDAVLKQLP